MRSATKRIAAILGTGAVAAAAAAGAAEPTVRTELKRLRRFSRAMDVSAAGTPTPPSLPAGRIVPVPNVGELFVRDTGEDGRTAVLLLHGWGATADVNFFTAYSAFADTYRVIALDHRGHGRGLRAATPFTLEDCADDAAALLGELVLEDAVVVGYSMGGPIALLLAQRHPDRVAGLVLEATALSFNDELRERVLWRGLNLVAAGLRHGRGDGVLQRALREAIDRQPALDPYRAWIAGELRRGNIADFVAAGRALSRFDGRGVAATIDVPVAVVVTIDDRLVPPRKQRALAGAIDATVFELAGDHDTPIVGGAVFGRVTRAAVDHVAGHRAPLTPALETSEARS